MKRTRGLVSLCGLAALALMVPPVPVGASPGVTTGSAVRGAPTVTWLGGGVLGVQQVTVSPDGLTVATAAQDNTVKLWRTSDGQMIRTLTSHNGHVDSVAFTPDGRFLASGGEFVPGDPSGNVKLWRVADGAFLGDFPVPQFAQAFSVAVSPDGTLLAGGLAEAANGGQINIWRISDRTLVRTLSGHTGSVFSVAFSPNGQLLASGSADNSVRVWRVSNGARVRRLTGHTFFVSSVAFSPDGTTLASGSWDTTVRLWRVSNWGLLRTLRGHTESVYSVAFAGNSQTIASGSGDHTIRLWRVSNGALQRTLPAPYVNSVAFIGSATLVGGGFDSHVRVWRTSDGALLTTMGKHTGPVYSVAFSPDSAVFASAGADTTARLWRSADGADLQTLAEHGDVVNAVAFSPDGRLVATAAGSPPPDTVDPTIKIWRVGTPASLLTLPGHTRGSTGVAFSADGSKLVSVGRDGVLKVWQVSTGALVATSTKGSPAGPLAISPQRKVVAVRGTGSTILLFTPEGAPVLGTPPTHGAASSMSFSGDGELLAVGEGAYGNNIEIFRVSDGALVRTLAGDPDGFVQGVAFAPTGSALVSGSGFSRVIQVWDTATGTLRTSYDQETGWGPFPQLPLAFSPSGTHFGYGRGDGPVFVVRNPL